MKVKKGTKEIISRDKLFDLINSVLMAIMLILFVYPLWFVVIASISDPSEVWNGGVILFPKGITMDGYKQAFGYSKLWVGYRNTIFYTVVGTLINVLMTVLAAYPLSRKDFPARKVLMPLILFTMYFSGGLIPTFLVVQQLHMVDTVWALLIPNAIAVYNVIITKTYFQNSIPIELKEAADLDGANTMQFFRMIVIPLSKPILAVISLYYGVGHWNAFFNALIYINNVKLMPLQLFLRDILIRGQMLSDSIDTDPEVAMRMLQLAETMKYNVIIIAALPMLIVYPFIQKFFVKGVMIGAVKG